MLDSDLIGSRLELLETIGRLSPKKQAAVALFAAGYTQRECGQIMGLTRAAAGYVLKAAKRDIRRIVDATTYVS